MPQWWIPGAPTPVVNVLRCGSCAPWKPPQALHLIRFCADSHVSCIMQDIPSVNFCRKEAPKLCVSPEASADTSGARAAWRR